MNDKAALSESMKSNRILSKGTIDSLDAAFTMDGEPFSICVIKTTDISDRLISAPEYDGLLVSCKLINEDTASDLPVFFNQWTEGAIKEIAIDAIDLATYTVYYGSSLPKD